MSRDCTVNDDEFLAGDGYSVSGYSVSGYDRHGNPSTLELCSTGASYQFTYDLEDRPNQMLLPGEFIVTYAEDAASHRVGKTVQGQTTKYVYDGDMVVAEIGPSGTTTYEVPGVGYVTSAVTGGVTTSTQNYYQVTDDN